MHATVMAVEAASGLFEHERRRLVSLAYHLLGTYSDAEDVVQEAWLRFSQLDASPANPAAWLTTVVTHLSLDRLRSARHRRETYVGSWLPEPVSHLPDPEAGAQARSLLSIGLLHLLEKLSPEERAVLVLREAFDTSYSDISALIGKSEANCRQLFSRAKKHLQDAGADRFTAIPASFIQRFVDALARGDEAAMLSLLRDDATLFSDGGGRVAAAINPIYTRARIARFLLSLLRKNPMTALAQLVAVNDQPALLIPEGAEPADLRGSLLAFAFDGAFIAGLYLVRNPDKLSAYHSGLNPRPSAPAPDTSTSRDTDAAAVVSRPGH